MQIKIESNNTLYTNTDIILMKRGEAFDITQELLNKKLFWGNLVAEIKYSLVELSDKLKETEAERYIALKTVELPAKGIKVTEQTLKMELAKDLELKGVKLEIAKKEKDLHNCQNILSIISKQLDLVNLME